MRSIQSAIWVALSILTAAPPAQARLLPRLGFEASGSYGVVSRTSADAQVDVLDAEFGAGWAAGLTADWTLAPAWGFASGLRYVESGESQTITITITETGGSTSTLRGDLHDTWRWLAVPLRARLSPRALPFSFEVGPEIQVLLQARSRQELVDVPTLPTSVSHRIRSAKTANIFEWAGTFGGNRDVTDLYRRTNFVIGGGLRFSWPVGAGHVLAHLRYAHGLNDLMKSDWIERRTRSLEVGAGWQW